jgi:hypothetical protein
MLIFNSGYRYVTLHQTSKNSSRLIGVNLLNSLLPVANIGGIQNRERQEQKAQVSKKHERERRTILLG